MYDFHYNFIKKHFDTELLFTDTESLTSNTAKGVNIATEFEEFKDTLFNKKIMRHKTRRIQGKKHKIGRYKIDKISLLCFDDKRFVLDDGIHALPYFHKDLKKQILTDDHKQEEILKVLIKRRDSHR